MATNLGLRSSGRLPIFPNSDCPSSFSRSSSYSSTRQFHPLVLPTKLGATGRVISGVKAKKGGVSDEEKSEAIQGLRTSRALRLDETNSAGEEAVSAEKFDWKWPPWKHLPLRYQLIGTTSLAFVICNMDKVNLSIAIIPMSHQFGWNSSMAGLVQSSFFWGYALSQLPGGWLAKMFGGRTVLEVGVLAWSLATMFVPLVAGFMPGLVFSRILVGIGEGVSPSAATALIARSIPLQERSRAVGFVFGGLSIGSVLGLLLAPPLIQNFGWESVFYIFGSLGVLWCVGFQFVKQGSFLVPREDLFGWFSSVARSSSMPGMGSWDASMRELVGSVQVDAIDHQMNMHGYEKPTTLNILRNT